MADSFGARLRYERERRRIALRSIAEGTQIGLSLLEGLERDDVSRWPSGMVRTSFVHAYAMAIGLDPDPIVREFVERYPDTVALPVGGFGGVMLARMRKGWRNVLSALTSSG